MRTVSYKLADLGKVVIHLGKMAENDATQVRIDAAEVFSEYPNAVPALDVINPSGEAYTVEVTLDGTVIVWDVKDSSLTAEGNGEIQLTFTQDGTKVKSSICRTKVCRSITGGGTAPDPVQDWLDHANEVLAEVEDAIPPAGTTGQVLAKKSDEDYDLEWVDQGSGGTTDYTDLTNKPQIGGVTLTGNVSLHDIGAAAESDIPDPTSIIDDNSTGASKVWSAQKSNELKSAFGNADGRLLALDGKIYIDYTNFRIGNITITNSGWTYGTNNKRVSTKEGVTYPLKKGDVISLSSYTDAQFYLGWQKADESYDSAGWNTSDYTCTVDGNYVINITNITEVEQTSVDALLSLLSIYRPSNTAQSVDVLVNHDKINMANYANLSASTSWVQGFLYNNWTTNINNNRAHSDLILLNKGDTVWFEYGSYEFEPILWDYDFTHLGGTGNWTSAVYVVPYDCIATINVRKSDNSNISSLFSDIASKLHIVKMPKNKAWEHNERGIIKSINHRGWYNAPENTIPAYKESYGHGFRFVETDIRFTSDDYPVCIHDRSINRTARNSDGTELSETVNIDEITLEQAQEYDFGVYKNAVYEGTKIATLAGFLDVCRTLDLLPYIDFGTEPALTKAQMEKVVSAVNDAGMKGKVTYIVGSLTYGQWIVSLDKTARIGLVQTATSTNTNNALSLMTGENEVFMDCDKDYITSEGIALVKSAGLPLELWVINTPSIIEEMDDYVSGVTSDMVNASDYLKSTVQIATQFSSVSASSNRATDITGGYVKKGNKVTVQCNFTSSYTATNTPGMLTGFPEPLLDYVPVMVTELNGGNVVESPNAYIHKNNNVVYLYMKNATLGNKYLISGEYYIV